MSRMATIKFSTEHIRNGLKFFCKPGFHVVTILATKEINNRIKHQFTLQKAEYQSFTIQSIHFQTEKQNDCDSLFLFLSFCFLL